MKHLDEYKIFESKEDIDSICRKYDIYNYTINSDGSIDVNGNIDLYSASFHFKKLPLTFNKVSGYFFCNTNTLRTLEGSPRYVGSYFSCGSNMLTSLEGGPKYVGGDLNCNNSNLFSLEGYPEHVGGDVNLEDNPIYNIVYHFIHRENKNNLIELFNYYDIVQDRNVIYDRLKFFYEGIDIKLTDWLLDDIEFAGYKIIR